MDLQVPIADEYQQAVKKYFDDIFIRLPKNTQRAYLTDIRDFFHYCQLNALPGLSADIETTQDSIQQYVSFLCQSPLVFSTIKRRLAAISKFAGIANLPNPLHQSAHLKDFIRLELIAFEKFDAPKQAQPMTLSIITAINAAIPAKTLLDTRDLAIVNTMFDALLRSGDLTQVQCHHLDKNSHALLVPRSKADQSGRGSYRYLSETSLNYITQYLHMANTDSATGKEKAANDPSRINQGILFRALSPKGTSVLPYDESITRLSQIKVLNYTTINRIFKRLAKRAGISLQPSTHSARVGAAVSMAEAGSTSIQIQQAGKWKSAEMPGRYTQQANVDKGGMANIARRNNR